MSSMSNAIHESGGIKPGNPFFPSVNQRRRGICIWRSKVCLLRWMHAYILKIHSIPFNSIKRLQNVHLVSHDSLIDCGVGRRDLMLFWGKGAEEYYISVISLSCKRLAAAKKKKKKKKKKKFRSHRPSARNEILDNEDAKVSRWVNGLTR